MRGKLVNKAVRRVATKLGKKKTLWGKTKDFVKEYPGTTFLGGLVGVSIAFDVKNAIKLNKGKKIVGDYASDRITAGEFRSKMAKFGVPRDSTERFIRRKRERARQSSSSRSRRRRR